MIKNLILIALTIMSFNALASEDQFSVTVGVYTKHFEGDFDYNENNKLLAFEYNNFVVGTFDNSFDDQTYLVGYDWHTEWNDFRFGVIGGAMYGYNRGRVYDMFYSEGSGTKLLPLALPYVSYNKYLIKPIVGVMGNAVTLLAKYEF